MTHPPGLEPLLAEWLPRQRWFGGKDQPVDDVSITVATCLNETHPQVWHLLVTVIQGMDRSYYQVPISIREHHDDRLEHVLIGETADGVIYDALHDKGASANVLTRIANSDQVGPLSFHREPGAEVPLGETSLVLTGEQSNTSLAYGDSALLKVFRRIRPGGNPDVELCRALSQVDCPHVAQLLGWVDATWTDPVTHQEVSADLAMLQTFLVTATDGWHLAVASVRDLFAEADLHADEVGGDFAGESHRLGETTANVHACLAAALPTGRFTSDDLSRLAESMHGRLTDAVATVPLLAPFEVGLRQTYDELAAVPGPVPTQRIHGDFHLGQALRTTRGWKLLDFEGEPAKSLEERVALDSPLRDVAGMLRSFDYAARQLMVRDHPGDPQIAYRAEEWISRNREAFCQGYAEASGTDPRDDPILLRAYETDKLVYEVVYEARNRPDWIGIPLAAIAHPAGMETEQ